jgi:hypothetical protein
VKRSGQRGSVNKINRVRQEFEVVEENKSNNRHVKNEVVVEVLKDEQVERYKQRR